MSEIRYVPPAASSGPTGSGAAGQVTFWSAATVLTGSNNLFWDNTNSRLGIGTTTPGVKLDIHGTGIIQQLNGLTTNNSYLDFQNAGITKFRIGNTYNAGQNRLSLFNAAGTTEILTALQSGNIGIGTNNPVNNLDVFGSRARIYNPTYANSSLVIETLNSADMTAALYFIQNSPNWVSSIGTHTSGGGANLGLQFKATPTAVNMVMNSDGSNYFGGTFGLASARIHIKGSGSTSATYSFFVQNASAQTKFYIDDSANANVPIKIGNDINGYSSLMWPANNVGFGLISGGGIGAVVRNASFIIENNLNPSDIPSAIFAVNSTVKGILFPRMTNAQRTAIGSPAIGLIVYCTDAVEGLYIYKSTGWTFII